MVAPATLPRPSQQSSTHLHAFVYKTCTKLQAHIAVVMCAFQMILRGTTLSTSELPVVQVHPVGATSPRYSVTDNTSMLAIWDSGCLP